MKYSKNFLLGKKRKKEKEKKEEKKKKKKEKKKKKKRKREKKKEKKGKRKKRLKAGHQIMTTWRELTKRLCKRGVPLTIFSFISLGKANLLTW